MTHNHDLFCSAFRKALLRVRKEFYITQHQLSLETGLTRQFLSQLEGGKRLPSYESFCVLSRGLGLTPAELSARISSIYEREYRNMENRLKSIAEKPIFLAAENDCSKEYIKPL